MAPTKRRGDQLRRPALCPHDALHFVPQPRPLLEPPPFRAPSHLDCPTLGRERAIGLPATIAGDLPAHRASMTTNPTRDHRVGLTPLNPDTDLFTGIERQHTPSRLAVAQHNHSFFADPSTQRPLRNPRPPRSLSLRRAPRPPPDEPPTTPTSDDPRDTSTSGAVALTP